MARFKWLRNVLAIGALAVLMTGQDARAVLALRVFSGPDTSGPLILTAFDNNLPPGPGTVNDQDPALGQLLLPSGGVGGLQVQNSFHTSNADASNIIAPLDTAIGRALLTSSSNAVANQTGGTIVQTVEVSSTNFGPFGLPVIFNTTSSGTWTNGQAPANTVGSSIAISYFADSTNTLWGTQQLVRQVTFAASGAALDSYSADSPFVGPFGTIGVGPFSMTLRFTLTLTPGTTLVSRGNSIQAVPVPEPTTLGAAAFGLIGLVFHRVRARRRSK